MKKASILIVDDEILIRRSLLKILKSEGYTPKTCSSGEKAIKDLKKKQYDLILLDIQLKGINGLETLKSIRSINTTIPVILISGYLSLEVIEEASHFGIFSYIRKPFSIIDLKHKIARAICD